jgi:hypothetical protein
LSRCPLFQQDHSTSIRSVVAECSPSPKRGGRTGLATMSTGGSANRYGKGTWAFVGPHGVAPDESPCRGVRLPVGGVVVATVEVSRRRATIAGTRRLGAPPPTWTGWGVLYEMVTGAGLFAAESKLSVGSSVYRTPMTFRAHVPGLDSRW